MLSYGGDTDDQTNPFEVRLGKYVDLDLDDEVVGIQALRQVNAAGVKRQQLGIVLDDPERRPGHAIWYTVQQRDEAVGIMTCGAWSPRAGSMIGFALVRSDLTVGDKVNVVRGGYLDPATLCPLPFF